MCEILSPPASCVCPLLPLLPLLPFPPFLLISSLLYMLSPFFSLRTMRVNCRPCRGRSRLVLWLQKQLKRKRRRRKKVRAGVWSHYKAGFLGFALLFIALVLSLLQLQAASVGWWRAGSVPRASAVSEHCLHTIFRDHHIDHLSSLHVWTSWVRLM